MEDHTCHIRKKDALHLEIATLRCKIVTIFHKNLTILIVNLYTRIHIYIPWYCDLYHIYDHNYHNYDFHASKIETLLYHTTLTFIHRTATLYTGLYR